MGEGGIDFTSEKAKLGRGIDFLERGRGEDIILFMERNGWGGRGGSFSSVVNGGGGQKAVLGLKFRGRGG